MAAGEGSGTGSAVQVRGAGSGEGYVPMPNDIGPKREGECCSGCGMHVCPVWFGSTHTWGWRGESAGMQAAPHTRPCLHLPTSPFTLSSQWKVKRPGQVRDVGSRAGPERYGDDQQLCVCALNAAGTVHSSSRGQHYTDTTLCSTPPPLSLPRGVQRVPYRAVSYRT